jgi:hypothetical protein
MARLPALSAGIAVAALLASAGHARALECGCSQNRPTESRADLRLATLAARYDTVRWQGDYQGVEAQGIFTHGRYSLNVGVPWYHLTRNGVDFQGIGDVNAGVSAVLLRPMEDDGPPLGLSASFTAMAPTGDPEKDLGMGHWMVMPGLLAWRDLGRFTAQGSVQYSRALQGGGAHAHHHGEPGTFPAVDPQNASEIRLGVGGDFRVTQAIALHAGFLAALPVAEEGGGFERYIASAGASFNLRRTRIGLEIQQPFASEPFDVRAVLSAAVRM